MPKSPWTARARRRAALLWSIGATVLVLALLLSLAAGLTGRAPAAQVRQTFADAAPAGRALTVTASTFELTAADQEAAARAIARAFGDAPIDVTHRTAAKTTTWVIAPDISRVTPADLPALQAGFDTIGDSLSTVLAGSGGVTVRGTAGATTATVRASVQTVSETAVLPLGIIATAGILAVGMLVQLLVSARTAEDRLLRSRGASAGRLIRRALAEAVAIAVPASLLGAAAAQAALLAWIGPPASAAEVVAPWLAALVGALAAVLVVAIPAATRPLGDAGTAGRRAPALAGVVVLLAALAGVCAWRFANAQDAAQVAADPLARIAPAAVLVALAAVVALLFTPVARAVERPVGRARRLPAPLAARLTARGSGLLAAPALLLALAVAVGTVATGAAATSETFLTDSARVAIGGAARLDFPGDSMVNGSADLLPEAVRADAVTRVPRAAPVLRTSASLSSVPVDIVGVPAARLPALVPVAAQMFDADAVRAALRPRPIPGPVLAGRRVIATIAATTVSGGPATASLTLWLVDRAGDAAPLALPAVPVTGGGRSRTDVSTALPAGGPWTVAAVDVTVQSSGVVRGAGVTLQRLAADGHDAVIGTRWTARTAVFGAAVEQPTPTGITATFPSISAGVVGGARVRLMPAGSATVPVVISDALAAQSGLARGTSTPMEGQVAAFQATIMRIVPLIPGTTGEPALLADLPTLVRGQLAQSPQLPTVTEAWTTDAATPALLDRYAAERQATVQLPSTAIESSFVRLLAASLWLGAIGAAAFAVLGVAATVAALQRRRRPEIDVLRQLGVSALVQARVRIVEPGAAVLFSLIAGAAAGMLAALLIVPAVARTSAPSAPDVLPVVPSFAWGRFGAMAAAIIVLTGILLVVQYRATLRTARGPRTERGAR